MWRNSEYILKVDPTRFPDELDMNVREKSKGWLLGLLQLEATDERILGEKINLVLDNGFVDILVDIQMKMMSRLLDILVLSLEDRFELKI